MGTFKLYTDTPLRQGNIDVIKRAHVLLIEAFL